MLRRVFLHSLLAVFSATALAGTAGAASARDLLAEAAFSAPTRERVRTLIAEAQAEAAAALQRDPADREAALQQAVAAAWRALVSRDLSLAREARRLIERQIAAQPENAEAHLAMGAWHVEALLRGGAIAGPMLGASRNAGHAALDRAVALAGNRALPPGYAALLRAASGEAQTGAGLARVLNLAQRAAKGTTPTKLDAVMKSNAGRFVAALASPPADAVAVAMPLLPFARVINAS